MAKEFLQECSNEWEGTIQRDLDRWTSKTWAKVYNLPKKRRGQASQADKFAQAKFSVPINPKDGYVVADCKDPRETRFLEFVVPILYPEKPTQITVTLSNTIFGALSRIRKVSWGLVM